MPGDSQDRAMRHRAYQLAYDEWFASLPSREQARLRALGLDRPETEQFGPVREDGDESPVPDASEWLHPMDVIEATEDDEAELGRTFGAALAWCCKSPNVVEIGRRLLVVMYVWRPSLLAGLTLQIQREMEDDFRKNVDADGSGGDGSALGPVLEWARRGTSLAQLGQRLLAMAYVLRPTVIGGRTLAAIGFLAANKTRQAVDKLVQDFRDTFGGLRSRTMRSETNRITCRKAQLRKT